MNKVIIQVTTFTDGNGRFSFSGIVPGRYTIKFELPGFEDNVSQLTLKDGDYDLMQVFMFVKHMDPPSRYFCSAKVTDENNLLVDLNLSITDRTSASVTTVFGIQEGDKPTTVEVMDFELLTSPKASSSGALQTFGEPRWNRCYCL